MPRVQAIVVRDKRALMVKHRQHGQEWWCLPGGAQERGETLKEGTVRELMEECNVSGTIVRQTSHLLYSPNDEAYSFLVDIGDEEPSLENDPDIEEDQQVLAEIAWLRLAEIPERDCAYLRAAGLMGIGNFVEEIEQWGNETSYPGVK